jgi:hypothetical protein
MGALLKVIPVIMAVIKRGKTLATLAQSKTTKAQYAAILIAACGIAGIGYFVPALVDNDVAVGLIVLVSPLISRLLLYKAKAEAKTELPSASATIWLVKVNKIDGDGSWIDFDGTMLDAKLQGHRFGVDEYGNVWDITDGTETGDTVRLNEPESPEEIAANRAKCEEWVKSARARMAERASTDNHEV